MNTKLSLMNDLEKAGVKRDGLLLVHSSMKAVGETDGGADTVLDALCEYHNSGILLLPTLSYLVPYDPDPYFDVDETPSCVGILPQLFRKREGVYRSCQPTHSVAGYGKYASDLLEGEEYCTTPCNRGSAWYKLYMFKGQVLMLGAPLTTTTFLHGVEEWAEIPERISKETVSIRVKTHSGVLTGHYHTHINHVSDNYGLLEKEYEASDFASRQKIGNADSWLFEAAPWCDFVTEKLKKDPDLFGNHE